jgi:hypothetical protein
VLDLARQIGQHNIIAPVREPLPQLGERRIFHLPCSCRIKTPKASERCGNKLGRQSR